MRTYKFGIIGTSCAGKTTLAHSIVGRLKGYGILADGLFSQDRKFSFDIKYLSSESAQNWMVANLIAQEVNLSLRDDVKVLITDRTPVDLFAYYAYQMETSLSKACWGYVKEWAKSYDAIYYLDPLVYQDDNKRPTDEFRLGVDETLLRLLEEVPHKKLPRHSVLTDILNTMGTPKPSAKSRLSDVDYRAIARLLGRPLVVKEPSSDDILSDWDMWVLDKDPFTYDLAKARQLVKGLVGAYVPLDLNVAADVSTFDFPYLLIEEPRRVT